MRAGMIQQIAAGVYSYLPLGWRTLRKIDQVVREELDAQGGQELLMPTLQPIELWEKTGRDKAFGKGLFTLYDRKQRKLALGPTHEEVITELVGHYLQSYRDLPLLPYQIQTKFRDEPRPRAGLMRVREFSMMDLYSFDVDEEGADLSYRRMIEAYNKIYRRCGLTALMVEADSGAIGGKDSHEFMAIAETGEDEVLHCMNCGYAANTEKATSVKPEGPAGDPLTMEEVATPGKRTIEEVAGFFGVDPSQTLKAVFYAADGKLVFVAIRGDLAVNEVKLKNTLKCFELRLATDDEVSEGGLVAGAASPLGLSGISTIADESITMGVNLVAGANRPDYHVRNVNYPRDFQVDRILDIALAEPGHGCPNCGKPLASVRGIELGHVFKLGTIFSEQLGATFLDQEGNQKPAIMGCYGIGMGRLLAAILECSHDDKGIVFPPEVAPYQVYLCLLGTDNPDVTATADKIYADLQAANWEVLFDDRDESPGVKFNDADLLGIPLRLTVSPRNLKKQSVELKWRDERDSQLVLIDDLMAESSRLWRERLARNTVG
jgi:prolyl-tRNA synthetase